MERHSAATAGGYMTYQDKDIGQLIKRIAQLEAALRGLLAEVEYVVSSASIPATWLDDDRPDLAIVNARATLERDGK